MNAQATSPISRFISYQRQRFPLAPLLISLAPAVLSSGAIVIGAVPLPQLFAALIASVAYLLHIRIIDEHRDFEHDNEHYRSRPIQSGVITREELRVADVFAIAVLVGIGISFGAVATGVVAVMLLYSYLAGKEFMLGMRIRKHFFVYNGINLVQMLLMQVLVYALFAGRIPLTTLVLLHFAFTSTGTVVFEFLRKLKIPGQDGTGEDTYTWHMGFTNALVSYVLLVMLNTLLFALIMRALTVSWSLWLALPLLALILAIAWACMHWTSRTKRTEQLMQASFLLQYGLFNLAIYFVIM
jgi:hypothetical protein